MSVLYLDIETTGLDPLTCELVTLQIMNSKGESKLIKDPVALKTVKSALERNLVVGHNIKFDSKFLKYHYGITLHNVYDTYLAEIAISGGKLARRKGASLKDLGLWCKKSGFFTKSLKKFTIRKFICHKKANNDTKGNSYSLKRQ